MSLGKLRISVTVCDSYTCSRVFLYIFGRFTSESVDVYTDRAVCASLLLLFQYMLSNLAVCVERIARTCVCICEHTDAAIATTTKYKLFLSIHTHLHTRSGSDQQFSNVCVSRLSKSVRWWREFCVLSVRESLARLDIVSCTHTDK